MANSTEPDMLDRWKLSDAFETYRVNEWGKGYFGINNLAVDLCGFDAGMT